jgi:hypothetical protein
VSIPSMSAIVNRLNRKTVHVSVPRRRMVLIVALTFACGSAALLVSVSAAAKPLTPAPRSTAGENGTWVLRA